MYNTIQKTIAAWAFNHYIAYYYFDNVNVSQLKVAFEKGEVELENLPIKKDALQHFNLPMEVISGIVGSLSIKVPLLTILTDPWIIKINNLMLIVAPKKQVTTDANSSSSTLANDDSFVDDANLLDSLAMDQVNSEETKLAEFYSSFSATMSAIVRDIYKNIRLEIESMTILFENFENGLVKFNVDSLLLYRPKSARNIILDNVSIHLSSGMNKDDDLLEVNLEKSNLDIYDEASNSMQLVAVSSTSSLPSIATTSEMKIEGNLGGVSIEKLINSGRKGGDKKKRNILKCDTMKLEFKLNNNKDEKLNEKNLQIKLDMVKMQYIHSKRIYELTTQRLTNLLKFFIKLQSKKSNDKSQLLVRKDVNVESQESVKKREDTSLNKVLMINIEEGLIYLVDDTSSSCAIPLLEISLEDCRIFQFSGLFQHNGIVFAKISCKYFNREVSTWEKLLQPWPFNLTWDYKINDQTSRAQHKVISLGSDEVASFIMSNAFLDLGDIALKRIVEEIIQPKLWPLASRLCPTDQGLSKQFDSIFVLHNETGHKLEFAPIENFSENDECSSRSSPTMDFGGDSIKSRTSSRHSPELLNLFNWIPVDIGESVSYEYESLPIYRRYINDVSARSRLLVVRVEGWKTLATIPIDKTGLFFREACSDRVMNEDTHIVVSIDLEANSARKIISIRSPLTLINLLDATLEVHFVESKHALYIKPESRLAVPLPYLFEHIHVRPCNVGVTMSEDTLLWDHIQDVVDIESKIHICHPITVTNSKHASYCTSQSYRICVSTQREKFENQDPLTSDFVFDAPVYSISFIAPITIVNLLPCKLQYCMGAISGTLNMGTQQRINHVDTTKPTDVHFKMNGYPQSKPINIDPGATGSFNQTLELIDKRNRSLYLNAKIILSSEGEEPAVQVIVYAPYWFINKTRLPLIFKQEGAVVEAAGQFREHEESPVSILLFSFYDTEMEQPWLCSVRMGKSRGSSLFCDGFKLEKGNGERRLCCIQTDKEGESRVSKSHIDINIRKGYGRYSETMIVTLTARYGFDPLTKTPKKAFVSSPQNYKLASYNHSANLAERIANQAVSLFNNHQYKNTSDMSLIVPGVKVTLVDNLSEKFMEASANEINVSYTSNSKEQLLDCSIQDVRIDNVLPDCEKSLILDSANVNIKPALRLIMDRIVGGSLGTTFFRQVQLSMCELVLNLEEKLMLKLVEFMSFKNRRQNKTMNNLSHDLDRILHPEEDRMSKYYFDLLQIDLSSLKFSVLGLNFFKFEDAQVQLMPYIKMNVSRTLRGVFDSVTRYYKRQILEQAPRLVGQQIQNYLRFHLSDMLSTIYDLIN